MLVVRKIGLTQVELPLESAPRLIPQCPLAIELIDLLPLGCDQQQLDFVGKRYRVLMILCPRRCVLKMTKAVLMLYSKLPNDVIRKPTFHGKLVEALDRGLDGVSARYQLLCPVGVELLVTGVGEPEQPDYGRQHQALAYERYQDDCERKEKNQIAIGEWPAVIHCEWNGKRRGKRHDTADAGESEHKRPLPRRRGIPAR